MSSWQVNGVREGATDLTKKPGRGDTVEQVGEGDPGGDGLGGGLGGGVAHAVVRPPGPGPATRDIQLLSGGVTGEYFFGTNPFFVNH